MLNDSSVLGRSGGNGGTLHMAYAGSLRKGDAIIGRMEDGCDGVFPRMGDAGSGRMGDRPEAFLRVFRMDDELSEEVEDEFL
jgi:hypothetical protein